MDIDNFYTPKDKLTLRYKAALENLENLPASFYLENDDNPDSQGTPNLELKKSFIEPIKNIPLYSKLLNGSYHTEKTSDPNIAAYQLFY